MAQETPIDVWNEITISQSGVGVTLYSEYGEGGGAVVEDETWFTFDELEGKAGDIISLNLSEESQLSLVEDDKSFRETVEESLAEEQQVSEGDVLIDDNPAPWSNDTRVVVEDADVVEPASDYYIVESGGTVAQANPSYPRDDDVILGHYEGSTKTYAFPESRLVQP
jgi:hypothetical protein